MQKNRKIMFLSTSLIAFLVPSLSGCTSKNTLLFLNWGEYISEELVEAFEEKYNVRFVVDIAESNELFYAKLKSGTTKYDLCCPSEYMVEKMYTKNLLEKMDFSLLENYSEDIFMDGVVTVGNEMDKSMKELDANYVDGEITKYFMPYFWGTFGLMYNKKNQYFKDSNNNLKPDIFEKYDNLEGHSAWDIYFFDEKIEKTDAIPQDLRVGMYETVRASYAASMIYDQGNPNAILNEENANKFEKYLSRRQYDLWGGDTLKHKLVADNLDVAFNYTGDCLDMTYVKVKEGANFEDLSFYTYTPKTTIAHIDSLVIPKGAKHKDLAYKFIDFMLDPVNQWVNARNVGYCPPLQKTYDMIVNKEIPDIAKYPYADYGTSDEENHWIDNWSKAMKSTYPLDENKKSLNKGIPLTPFDTKDLKTLNNIVNNIKAK